MPASRAAVFCVRRQAMESARPGCVLRDGDGPEGDLDILARFAHGARHGLFGPAGTEEASKSVFRRKVAPACRAGVESAGNRVRCTAIPESRETIYAA